MAGIMGISMINAVGRSESIKLEGRRSIASRRPVEPFRAQGLGCTGQIDEVPGSAVIPIAMLIGIVEIPPEAESADHVVEPQ